jgi:rhodanese-related sulfurtransferase
MAAQVRTITRDEVRSRMDAGRVVVLEVLPPMHYEDAHLPGALNLPPDRVDELAPKLVPDADAEIVVYCSNLACQNSPQAARRLVQLGYTQVYDYEGGKQDWIDAGLPTETTAPETTPRERSAAS